MYKCIHRLFSNNKRTNKQYNWMWGASQGIAYVERARTHTCTFSWAISFLYLLCSTWPSFVHYFDGVFNVINKSWAPRIILFIKYVLHVHDQITAEYQQREHFNGCEIAMEWNNKIRMFDGRLCFTSNCGHMEKGVKGARARLRTL